MTQDHIAGFIAGVAVTAAALYVYKKNQTTVDDYLRQHGINLPPAAPRDFGKMTMEELVSEKERLEDLIAEREQAAPTLAAAT
jgi:hypothetical protein